MRLFMSLLIISLIFWVVYMTDPRLMAAIGIEGIAKGVSTEDLDDWRDIGLWANVIYMGLLVIAIIVARGLSRDWPYGTSAFGGMSGDKNKFNKSGSHRSHADLDSFWSWFWFGVLFLEKAPSSLRAFCL